MNSTLLEQARKLSDEEQLELIEALWDDLAQRSGVPLPTEAQLAELDRRIADDNANPDDVVPWEQVQSEVRERISRVRR